ncbi:toxin-antitoxin system HicB family antitoxin [Streptomyces sp. NPDC001970]
MIKLNLRMTEDLHARLVVRATADRRSLNAEILHFIEVALSASVVDAESPGGDSATSAPLRGKPNSSPA